MTEDLFKTITTPKDADKAIEACQGNPLLTSMIEPLKAHKAMLEAKIAEEQKWEPFLDLANTTLGDLPPVSEDWRKHDATQAITIYTEAVTDTDAKPQKVKLADGTVEERLPLKLVRKVKLGVMATQTPTGKAKAEGTRKLAIVVFRLDDAMNAETIGTFRNAAEACKHLGIDVGGDSAARKLSAAGYYTKTYDGTEFTMPES